MIGAAAQGAAGVRVEPVDLERLTACLALRRRVFVEEQGVPADLEVDGLDASCQHFVVWGEEELLGTARLRQVEASGEERAYAKAERVAVLPEARGQGLGSALMRALEQTAKQLGYSELCLAAQTSAVAFYERLGYASVGNRFMEAGIEHQRMRKPL